MVKGAREKKEKHRTKQEKGDSSQGGNGDSPQEISQEKPQGEVDREWRCLTCSTMALWLPQAPLGI
jgi:hypothetical protein